MARSVFDRCRIILFSGLVAMPHDFTSPIIGFTKFFDTSCAVRCILLQMTRVLHTDISYHKRRDLKDTYIQGAPPGFTKSDIFACSIYRVNNLT